jgi:hypothetical protein
MRILPAAIMQVARTVTTRSPLVQGRYLEERAVHWAAPSTAHTIR